MILMVGMLLLPIGYGGLYLAHSIRTKRRGQALSVGALLLVCASAEAVLLWEFFALP